METKDKTNNTQIVDKIVDRVLKLFSVKSIMTLALTATFVVLAGKQVISGDKFYDIFLMVVSFYFGTQAKKDS